MKIPDEVVRRANGAGANVPGYASATLRNRESYRVIAEWARKEALWEVEAALDSKPQTPWFKTDALEAIRALAEGDKSSG